jgi:hypothetical protein
VYANDYLNPKPVPIRQGSLQILMYDGPMGTNSAPLRTWNYGPEQLKQHEFRARIGTGYEFTLPWGDTPPRSKAVTMQADYRSADGRRVRSRPSSITVEDLPKR